ncbi:MAG TPA: hypothetical protein VGK16_12590 [Candidatus Limnocylindrales bacterium]
MARCEDWDRPIACGLSASVRITHADADRDTLVIDRVGGTDDIAIDPALAALIQVSVP